jgi:hypothetical protein
LFVKGTSISLNDPFGADEWVGELEVDSLQGINPAGGRAIVNGRDVAYTGVKKAFANKSYIDGTRNESLVSSGQEINLTITSYVADSGALPNGVVINYMVTIVSDVGETFGLRGFGKQVIFPGDTGEANANHIVVHSQGFRYSPGHYLDTENQVQGKQHVTGINLYRYIPAFGWRMLGSFGIMGGIVEDTADPADEKWEFTTAIPTQNTADEYAYYLTGVSERPSGAYPIAFQLDDLPAQAVIAALIGGGDDGVIEAEFDVGQTTVAQARALGMTYLKERSQVNIKISYDTDDPNSHPGQFIPINLPFTCGIIDDLRSSSLFSRALFGRSIHGYKNTRPPRHRHSRPG